MEIIILGIGGALGTISRFLISRFMNSTFPLSLIPWGTIIVNIIGAFTLAFVLTANQYKLQFTSSQLLFFGSGFLGAFTTFSTFTYETMALFRDSPVRAFVYLFITLFAGFSFAYFGYLIGKWIS